MQTGETIYKGETPHPTLLVGMLSVLSGMMFESIILIGVGAVCLGWWLQKKHKPNLLRKHDENTSGETIDLGNLEIPLTECSLGSPTFHYFLRGLPQVTQSVTARDPETGAVTQYLLITRSSGRTLLHPIINK